eukprot:1155784_1
MWTHLTKGKHTAESISTAPCAALECGLIRLKHSNLQNMPPCIIMHAFSFLDVIDYVCAVSLVCHEWNLSKNDILCTKHTAKLKLLKEIASNSFEVHLKYMELPLSKNDLLYEMETSIAFAILHTKPCYQAFNQKQCFDFDSITFPPQPLYFSSTVHQRRFSYFYLLHYIYLYKFGKRNMGTFHCMYALLSRVVITGSILCIGFMMHLFYDKYGTMYNYLNYFKEDKYNKEFWSVFRYLFLQFYEHHLRHVPHKPFFVVYETIHGFVKVLETYASTWNRPSGWINWPEKFPLNPANHLIIEAHHKYCSM